MWLDWKVGMDRGACGWIRLLWLGHHSEGLSKHLLEQQMNFSILNPSKTEFLNASPWASFCWPGVSRFSQFGRWN